MISVTRLGEISPLWQKNESPWQMFEGLFLIWQMLSLLWQICYIIGLIFIAVVGQILKYNLIIWSH